MPPIAGWVTVLLLMMVGMGAFAWRGRLALASHGHPFGKLRAGSGGVIDVQGKDALATEQGVRVCQFSSNFQLPYAPGRLDGVMASDGLRHRIAIYWIEPYIYRESDLFVRYADFIVTPEAAHYWIQGMLKPGMIRLSADSNDSLLPRVDSAEALARCALAIMGRSQGNSLEIGKFFRSARDEAEYKYEVLPAEADTNRPIAVAASDVQIMNDLPYGREFLKVTLEDGMVGWRLRKALDGLLLSAVTVKPVETAATSDLTGLYDPSMLGQWSLVPDAFRVYWSFDKMCTELDSSADKRVSSRRAFDKIGAYLHDSNAPARVCRALDRLRFKAALETGDANCVWRAAEAAVAGFCGDRTADPYQCLLQLGSMSGKIDKLYPQRAEERLSPLVAQAVKRARPGLADDLERLLAAIERNRWLTYRKLLIEEVAKQEAGAKPTTRAPLRQEDSPNDEAR